MPVSSPFSSRWYRLIPVVFITYSLAYLDRANFAFVSVGEMKEDLHLTTSSTSLLGSVFFLGYFIFQIPGARYAGNRSARKLIFLSLIFWGLLAMLTGIVNNFGFLLAIRFMLGVVESAVMPALLILLSRWFTKSERSRANTFLILGNPITILWMSVLSGYLIHSSGWRWMFIWEGFPAILWSIIWWRQVKDRPEEVLWLTPTDKAILTSSLQKEQEVIRPVKNYRAALCSKAVILLSVQYTCWSIGVYGFVMWLPSIIKSEPEMSIIKTGWLSSFPYVFAMTSMLIVSHFSDKTLKRKIFVWPFLLIASLAFYSSFLLGPNHFNWSYSLLMIAAAAMYAPYGSFFAIIPEIIPANVTAEALALINSSGALGSFAGAYLVGYLNGITGSFGASYAFMALVLLIASGISFLF
jgi:sugar phosphate permease